MSAGAHTHSETLCDLASVKDGGIMAAVKPAMSVWGQDEPSLAIPFALNPDGRRRKFKDCGGHGRPPYVAAHDLSTSRSDASAMRRISN